MSNELTPMMKQYMQTKRGIQRIVSFFYRLGDFMKCFFDDALTASKSWKLL